MAVSGIFVFSSVLLLATLARGQAKPPETGGISGIVTNSVTGQPLPKVEISAEGSGDDATHVPFAVTDSRGSFALPNLVPGQYHLTGRRSGYLDTPYGARHADAIGTPITVNAGQELKDLQFRMLPYGVIAGTVRDQDGEPLDKVHVEARRMKYGPGGKKAWSSIETDTNDLGEYRISDLAPGRYFVRAEPNWTEGRRARTTQRLEILVPAIYPGVQDPAAARPLQVDAGARVTGIDFMLPRRITVRVSGHVTVPPGTKLGRVTLTSAGPDAARLGFETQAQEEPNGDFDFAAVPAGAWTITATASPPQKPTSNVFDLMFYQSEYKTSVPLQVGDLPVENVRLTVDAGAEITGRISFEPGAEGKLGGGSVAFRNGSDERTLAKIHDDLTFETSLGAGLYEMDRLVGDGFIVHSITLDGKNLLDEGLTITGHGKIALEVVVSKDGGQIEGVVLDKEGRSVEGATVVLVPEMRLRRHESLFREGETDQNGRYRMKAIPPGDYKLFAWEDVEPGSWWDADFLRQYEEKGEAVTVKPNGTGSTELHLAPR